jgi:nucleotide-binding universal stress UspA family protein
MKKTIDKIVCAFDFSNTSKTTLNLSIEIAKRQKSSLILAHIAEGGLGDIKSHSIVKVKKSEAQNKLIELSEAIKSKHDIQCSCIVDHGFVASEICKMGESEGADLLVIGQSGESGTKESFAGSNVMSIVRKSEIPVLVVPENTHKTTFENILFPIRPIEGQSVKFNIVIPILRQNKSIVHLLGLTEGRNMEQLNKMENEFETIQEKMKSENTIYSFEKCTCDDLAEKVLSTVDREKADLVVLDNSYQSNGLLFSYYVHKIINTIRVPVLVVDPI